MKNVAKVVGVTLSEGFLIGTSCMVNSSYEYSVSKHLSVSLVDGLSVSLC